MSQQSIDFIRFFPDGRVVVVGQPRLGMLIDELSLHLNSKQIHHSNKEQPSMAMLDLAMLNQGLEQGLDQGAADPLMVTRVNDGAVGDLAFFDADDQDADL